MRSISTNSFLKKAREAQAKRLAPLQKSIRKIAKADIDILIDLAKDFSDSIDKD